MQHCRRVCTVIMDTAKEVTATFYFSERNPSSKQMV